jgi:hypothetical protein
MSRPTPWDDIKTPESDYNVRLLAGSGSIPVYWAKDTDGRCLLVADLGGDHSAQFRRDSVSVHGIKVDLRQADTGHDQRFVLTLENQVDRDIFLSLCETLIAVLAPVTDPAVGLAVVLSQIKRWKAFLAGRKTRQLSPEEVRGLFAELEFLRTLYRERLSHAAAIEAWCGAEGVHQDFIFGNRAVEIKSLSGRERSRVRISSEDQLESQMSELFLTIYRLSELPDSDHACSLNEVILRVEGELTDVVAREEFSRKLATFGYAPLIEYDLPRLQVTGVQTYRVAESFPRIVRSRIPVGIAKVAYDIELEHIAPFSCENDEIFKEG